MEATLIIVYLSVYIGLIATTFYILSFLSDKKKEKLLFNDDELPFVSVVIPALNEEECVEKTLKSVLAFDYPRDKFEVIFVDDGSTDNTRSIAKKFEGDIVKVFHRENTGSKAAASNFGFSKAKGEIILSMDADSYALPGSMKKMVRYFKDENVMAVSPAMVIEKPKGILARIQSIEYLTGLFLRKAFAALDSIYITPGAFTTYRKSFFDKYGDYEVDNITEDLEMAMRIQSKGYRVENCPEAPVFTTPMTKFKPLLIQRRRWYFGLIKNTLKYKRLFGRKYGDLGTFVMPIAWISILFSIFIVVSAFFKIIFDIHKEILFLQSINFNFGNIMGFNFYVVERFLYHLFSSPIVLAFLLFIVVLLFYLRYASRKIGKSYQLIIDLPLFFLLFALLFGFWWIVSIFYAIFFKEIKWR
jgi:cellulose synthase/poly-beta-1,6-N-acetylglucosamine synthase-like glycosyltransferase